MADPIKWVSLRVVLTLHDRLIAQFGGLPGLRDEGLLMSALARPEQATHYGQPDHAFLSAIYAVSIAKNHAFVDGNKRTGFAVAATFLELNGSYLSLPEPEAVVLMLNIAKGRIDETAVAGILRPNCLPIGKRGNC
jgi:death on curing protein